jgi:hypothetical protein
MGNCPYDKTLFCATVGWECATCKHNPERDTYIDEEYDAETEDATRVDYDESDPW